MNDEQVFAEAIALPSHERLSFLDKVCIDMEQRQRMDVLLAAHERPDSLFDHSEVPSTAADAKITEMGESIGPYKLREQIGEGGMGTVYVAEQGNQSSICVQLITVCRPKSRC